MNIIKKSSLFLALSLFVGSVAFAQDKGDGDYRGIEETQDRIETTYMAVYEILDDYPEAEYTYVYEDGSVVEVEIEGIPNNRDAKQLEVHLIDLNELKKDIQNMATRVGVYYVTETAPKPKVGYEDFYENLYRDIEYPEEAENKGVEGTIFVKFVVDTEGMLDYITASEDIETPISFVVDDMKQEAIDAVTKTSGEWTPAKIGGVAVPQLVMVPVQFKLNSPYFRPIF
jgi:TonB family protein